MGDIPSQVRQDSTAFYNGYHGVGYNVSAILEQIGRIAQLENKKNTIISAGNLGQSLSNYDDEPKTAGLK